MLFAVLATFESEESATREQCAKEASQGSGITGLG